MPGAVTGWRRCSVWKAGEYERAVSVMEQGLMERAGDLYSAEGFRVLARCGGYDALIRVYEQLPEEVAVRVPCCLESLMALYRIGGFGRRMSFNSRPAAWWRTFFDLR